MNNRVGDQSVLDVSMTLLRVMMLVMVLFAVFSPIPFEFSRLAHASSTQAHASSDLRLNIASLTVTEDVAASNAGAEKQAQASTLEPPSQDVLPEPHSAQEFNTALDDVSTLPKDAKKIKSNLQQEVVSDSDKRLSTSDSSLEKETQKASDEPQTQNDTPNIKSQHSARPKETPQSSTAHLQSPPFIRAPIFRSPPVSPVYPSIDKRRGRQGTVVLEVWLDALGQQTHLLIHQSSGASSLDQSAIAAVKHWEFAAHQIDGVAIASRVHVPVRFALH